MFRRDRLRQQWESTDIATWQPVRPPRAVEGPLPTAMYAGQTLLIEPAAEQVTLVIRDGDVAQVLFDSAMPLDVPADSDAAGGDDRLVFIRPDVPISWQWQEDMSLAVDTAGLAAESMPLRGQCTVAVCDPVTLYRRVLAGLDDWRPEKLHGALDAVVRRELADRLRGLDLGFGIDLMRARILLDELTADDLDQDLAPFGLRCLHLAAYSPPPGGVMAPDGGAAETVPVVSYDDVL
jgi:hypothetical protein